MTEVRDIGRGNTKKYMYLRRNCACLFSVSDLYVYNMQYYQMYDSREGGSQDFWGPLVTECHYEEDFGFNRGQKFLGCQWPPVLQPLLSSFNRSQRHFYRCSHSSFGSFLSEKTVQIEKCVVLNLTGDFPFLTLTNIYLLS